MPRLSLRNLKNNLLRRLFPSLYKPRDKRYPAVVKLIGYRPRSYRYFRTAFRHSSVIYTQKVDLESNERLEFLGDAVLDLVISEVLFEKYPKENEGELTKLRVKVVNRAFLNQRAVYMGIPDLLQQFVGKKKDLKKARHNVYGNALEALIGAIYLDKGLVETRRFIRDKVLPNETEMKEILSTEKDFKSQLMSWSQKNNQEVDFVEVDSPKEDMFTIRVKLGSQFYGKGEGKRKKIAHQKAAKETLIMLGEMEEE